MKTESIKELVQLCIAGNCTVKLEACKTGTVAIVSSNRGEVFKQTSAWLDINDSAMDEKLKAAVGRVQ
jgi:hypothetical protein